MMRCEQVEELLPAYVDEDISEGDDLIVRQHLDTCGECATTLNYLRRADTVVAGWPAVPADMRPRLPTVDRRVLPHIRRQRRPSFSIKHGRALNLAGMSAFVAIVAVITIGLAVTLSRMGPKPDKPTPAAVDLDKPELMVLFNKGEGTRIKPGSERYEQLAPAVEMLLGRVTSRIAHASEYEESVDYTKKENAGLELIYPAPGARPGGHGPHRRVFINLWAQPGDVEAETGFWIFLGDRRYTEAVGARAAREMIDLSNLLDTGELAGYELGGWRISEKDKASGTISGFLQTYANAGNSERDAAEARAFLKPEYAASIPDFANLGIPRQANGLTPSFPDKQLSLKISGNRATETIVYDIEDQTFTQKFHLERINGEWWISGIEPAATTPSDTVYTADELREQEEHKVGEVVTNFLYAVVAGHAGDLDDVDPRSYLAPGADSVISDLEKLGVKRLIGGGPYSYGTNFTETQIAGDDATTTARLDVSGQQARSLRFSLEKTANRWLITAVQGDTTYCVGNIQPEETPIAWEQHEEDGSVSGGVSSTSSVPPLCISSGQRQRAINAALNDARTSGLTAGRPLQAKDVSIWYVGPVEGGQVVGAIVTLALDQPATIEGDWVGLRYDCEQVSDPLYKQLPYQAEYSNVSSLLVHVDTENDKVVGIQPDAGAQLVGKPKVAPPAYPSACE